MLIAFVEVKGKPEQVDSDNSWGYSVITPFFSVPYIINRKTEKNFVFDKETIRDSRPSSIRKIEGRKNILILHVSNDLIVLDIAHNTITRVKCNTSDGKPIPEDEKFRLSSFFIGFDGGLVSTALVSSNDKDESVVKIGSIKC